jgi:RNA recognition motif-containing protein
LKGKLFIGIIVFSVDDSSLTDAFSQYGTVTSARIVTDKTSGRSRGFGFVEMANDTEASAAINGMNGKALDGRELAVSEAKPKAPGEARGGYSQRSRSSSSGGGGRRY